MHPASLSFQLKWFPTMLEMSLSSNSIMFIEPIIPSAYDNTVCVWVSNSLQQILKLLLCVSSINFVKIIRIIRVMKRIVHIDYLSLWKSMVQLFRLKIELESSLSCISDAIKCSRTWSRSSRPLFSTTRPHNRQIMPLSTGTLIQFNTSSSSHTATHTIPAFQPTTKKRVAVRYYLIQPIGL